MCVATGKLDTVTVWGCSQLRRSVIESLKEEQQQHQRGQESAGDQEGKVESGNALDQLRHMKKNCESGAEDGHATDTSNVSCKFPTLIGFLDV
jgi:hypothetical protein